MRFINRIQHFKGSTKILKKLQHHGHSTVNKILFTNREINLFATPRLQILTDFNQHVNEC